METEIWHIDYDMRLSQGRVVHISEPWPIRVGYHQQLLDFYNEHEFDTSERVPVYKVRNINGKTYVELLLEGDRTLPLRINLPGEVVVSRDHPITLTAPDGTRYTDTLLY